MTIYGNAVIGRDIALFLSAGEPGPDGSFSSFDLRRHLLDSDYSAEFVAEQMAIWRLHYFADAPGAPDASRFRLSDGGEAAVEELSRAVPVQAAGGA